MLPPRGGQGGLPHVLADSLGERVLATLPLRRGFW